MSLTKIDLIASIYKQSGMSKKECVSVVDSVFEIMKDEMNKGNDIMISGFGKWKVKSKKDRKGRNPQTGEAIVIEARKVATFKASQVLSKTVNPE
jgi:integration host factor subunit alpha